MRVSYINLAGQRHPLCFSLSATQAIGAKFGGLDGMSAAIQSPDLGTKLQAVDDVLEILMAAGRRYCAVSGEQLPPPLPCRPSDLIDATDPDAVDLIFSAISDGSERELEAVPAKNAAPTQGL